MGLVDETLRVTRLTVCVTAPGPWLIGLCPPAIVRMADAMVFVARVVGELASGAGGDPARWLTACVVWATLAAATCDAAGLEGLREAACVTVAATLWLIPRVIVEGCAALVGAAVVCDATAAARATVWVTPCAAGVV